MLKISDSFIFCPRCNQPRAESSQAQTSPFRCHACDYTFFFNPVVAIAAIVTNAKQQVLMLVRNQDPGKGLLGLPGGFVDPDESAETALAREVMEEVNLSVTEPVYLCSFPNKYEYKGIVADVLDLFFMCKVNSFEDLRIDEDEIADAFFVNPTDSELNKMAFGSNRRALQIFREMPSSSPSFIQPSAERK